MTDSISWLPDGGEMGGRVRSHEWAATPLGPPTTWPKTLRTMVQVMLQMRQPAAVCWGPEATLLYNDEYCAILRHRHPSALGQGLLKVWPELGEVLKPAIDSAMAGVPQHWEDTPFDLASPDGELVRGWFTATWTPITDDGSGGGFLMVATETSAYHLAQQALHRSEQRYRALMTAGTYSIYRMSPDWKRMYQLDSQTLATTADAIEDWADKYILEDDRPRVFAAIDHAIRTKSLFELEHRVRLADGSIGWVVSRAVPLLGADGEITEWFGAGSDISDRRLAAEKLRENEEKYRALFASMDQAYAVVEVLKDAAGNWADFRFLEVNPAFMEHTSMPYPVGKTATELLGTPNPRWTQLYGQALDSGKPLRVEEAERTLGRTFDLNIFSLDREQNRVAVLFTNITARKRAEEALREGEARLAVELADTQELHRISSSLIVEDDVGALYARFLEAARSLMRSEMASIQRLVPDRQELFLLAQQGFAPESAKFWEWVQASSTTSCGVALAGGEPVIVSDVETWDLVSGTEDLDHYRLSGIRAMLSMPLASRNGQLVGIISTHWREVHEPSERELRLLQVLARQAADLLERRAAEEALRESEERFRQFGEASQDVLWMRDAETLQWTYLTPAFEAIYGLSRQEALYGDNYRNWLDLVVPEDRDRAHREIERVREGQSVVFEYRVRRPGDGEVRWLRNTDFPVSDGNGKVSVFGGIGEDITEEKRDQERMAVLVAELQHRVRNILAVVRSVFFRTAQNAESLEELADHFKGRLDSLARTQVIVTQSGDGIVNLEDLIREELLSAGVSDGALLTLEGPEVDLPSGAAETLGLAIHELTTNSVKYGAIGSIGGKLIIRWSLNLDYGAELRLLLTWQEEGVSALSLKPTRQGFGTELIKEALPYRLGAETSLELRPGGIRCVIDMPLPAADRRQAMPERQMT